MDYQVEIEANKTNPQRLEELYQAARRQGETGQFWAGISGGLQSEPDSLLLQAWRHRLLNTPEEGRKRLGQGVKWGLALLFAVLNGLAVWLVTDPAFELPDGPPVGLVLAVPLVALFVIWFLALSARRNYGRGLLATIGLATVTAAALLLYFWMVGRSLYAEHYLIMIILHLALLAWVAVGILLVGLKNQPGQRFAFMIRSLEVFVVAGVYLIAGMAFGAITLGMFQALDITFPDWLMRLCAAGGAGLIPVLAVATIYQPGLEPAEQDFTQGLSKFINTLMRLLLPLTLIVLVVYVLAIPFNFLEPFKNRDVLIIYNVMLFAILGLLIGATPLDLKELSPRLAAWMRGGILAVAGLGTGVSLYALSAILYRTFTNDITLNRLIMIGWNVINIVLLVLVIVRLVKVSDQPWNERLKGIYSLAAVPYVAWALFVILVTPFLFR